MKPQNQPPRPPKDNVYLGYRDNRQEFGNGGAAVQRLAGHAKHDGVRIAKAKEIEDAILTTVPFPFDVKFDLCCNQPPFFDSFIYTEFGHGMLLLTQSVEINHRLLALAAETGERDTSILDGYLTKLSDKYVLKNVDGIPAIKGIVVLPGSNRMKAVDLARVQQILDEDPEVMVKPHPLTNEQSFRELRARFRHDRMLDPKISGFGLIKRAETVYTTTSSETCLQSFLMGKHVVDVSNYEFASGGTYAHINYQLFEGLREGGMEEARARLAAILSSPLSGILEIPDGYTTNDYLPPRIVEYVQKALELREHWRLMVRPARY